VRPLAICLLAGCAAPTATAAPPSGCLEIVSHGHGRGAHSHLLKDHVEVPFDLVPATAGDPAAQSLALRARREDRAVWAFVGAMPTLFVGAIIVGVSGTDRPRHLEPWAKEAMGTLLGGVVLSLGIAVGLAAASGRHEEAAIRRFNDDLGCGHSSSM
jgi:hypothetical protein